MTEGTAPEEKSRERVEWLESEVRRHRDLYYAGRPELSDAEFDALEDELRALHSSSGVLEEVGAAPQSTASLSGAGLPTKAHQIPMGSLDKVTEDRLDFWVEKTGKSFLVQEKLDGISLELEYDGGRLVDAITRGNGFVGEVITHNAVSFRNVRKALNRPFTGSVRGEVILRLSDFEEHFVGKDFSNPRNTVSGTSRKKHGDRSLNRYFEMQFYDVVTEDEQFATEREKMDYLRDQLGFTLAQSYFDCDADAIRRLYDEYQGVAGNPGRRFDLDYEIDGLVVRVDDLATQRELGSVQNRPRFAMAYKFPSEGRTTTLRALDWSVGLSARVTPVARLEPVEIAGVTVSNASLHNADYVVSLDLKLGDLVLVERKGDVIPKVMRVVESHGKQRPQIPKKCPECSAGLEFSGKHLHCPNADCPAKAYGDIYRWIQELEIDSLGEKWVTLLIENELVTDPADLYSLTIDDLLPLERMGETLATKFVGNIQETRRPTLDRFIAGLNIPEFSRQRAQMLVDAGFDDLEKMTVATVADFAAVKGFAEVLAEKAVTGLKNRRDRINRLLKVGVEVEKPEPRPDQEEGELSGLTFCFTGAIRKKNSETGKAYTRKQMQQLVIDRGGKTLNGVSAGLSYLVMANPESTSTKVQKARKLGTKILSEDDFFELLQDATKKE